VGREEMHSENSHIGLFVIFSVHRPASLITAMKTGKYEDVF